ncbi:hypothetical protein QJQ45_022766 [Haematococcus lacustris]|nr:hypothetical protein QJQ45_022766 [Haematococcus lacustris]
MASMTRAALMDIVKEHKLYRTPALNDKLYCNFKGFTNIAGLEEYTGLRALFLEGNAIESLEGLSSLKELRCLYAQQNALTHISGLEELQHLNTLNISQNHISHLEGLSCCPELQTLICTNNQLRSVDSISHLAHCTSLQTLDLQHNDISDPAVMDVLRQLTQLRCLYLKGNPVVSAIRNYRKSLIAALPELKYLDERPVFDDERRLVQAWSQGGVEAERLERAAIKAEEQEAQRRNFEAMQQIRQEGWRKRRAALGLTPGDTDPALDEFSDSEYEFEREPEELVAARERLAAFTARPGEEEPPELSVARSQRAGAGLPVTEGSWEGAGAAPGDQQLGRVQREEVDAQVYLEAVRGHAQELAAQGCAEQGQQQDQQQGQQQGQQQDQQQGQQQDQQQRQQQGQQKLEGQQWQQEQEQQCRQQEAGQQHEGLERQEEQERQGLQPHPLSCAATMASQGVPVVDTAVPSSALCAPVELAEIATASSGQQSVEGAGEVDLAELD